MSIEQVRGISVIYIWSIGINMHHILAHPHYQNMANEDSLLDDEVLSEIDEPVNTSHVVGWGMEMDESPEIPVLDHVWQPVEGVGHKFFVYSAYYDSNERENSVRVIGATKRVRHGRVQCKVRFSNNVTLSNGGTIESIRDHHRLEYAACFIKCPLIVDAIPESVSIVACDQTSHPTNNVRVINTKMYAKSNRLGICVKPLHYSYDKTVQLVEFMEMNRILGMDHVTFYNSSISPTTDCILRMYVDEGRATVLPWKDHFVSQKEIRTENMFAALNDCLYRNRHNFSYLAFIDTDEFIMPRNADNIRKMLKKLDQSDRIGSFNFRNVFFYLQWPSDPSTNSSKDDYEKALTTLLKTRRLERTQRHLYRSKFIVKPTYVRSVGNHAAGSYERGHHRYEVDPKDGILSHYRVCEFGGDKCLDYPSRVDNTAFQYKPLLVAAVKRRWQALQRRCGIGGIQQAQKIL